MANTVKLQLIAQDGTTVDVECLADGRVKWTTGTVGPTYHASLEAALKGMNYKLGGEATRSARGDAAQTEHHHHGEQEHSH